MLVLTSFPGFRFATPWASHLRSRCAGFRTEPKTDLCEVLFLTGLRSEVVEILEQSRTLVGYGLKYSAKPRSTGKTPACKAGAL